MAQADYCRRRADGAEAGPLDRAVGRGGLAAVVAFRRHTLLPPDAYLYALKPTFPHPTRSPRHRSSWRHVLPGFLRPEGKGPDGSGLKANPAATFYPNSAMSTTKAA